MLLAFAISFTRASLICVYAVGWRLAAFLITEGRIETFEVFRYYLKLSLIIIGHGILLVNKILFVILE